LKTIFKSFLLLTISVLGVLSFPNVASALTISGTVYTDASSTVMTTTPLVRIKIEGAGDYSATADSNGNYSISGISISATTNSINAYLDDETENGTTTSLPADTTSDIAGFDIF